MEEMKRSLQKSMSELAWPTTQYLWPLHPIFNWVNDKAGLLFGRTEAPLIGLSGSIPVTDHIFIVAGLIPNRKSTPVVDEWFGLYFRAGKFSEELTMDEVIARTGFGRTDLPNLNILSPQRKAEAEALLPLAVVEARKVLKRYYENYKKRIEPQISEELDKLAELEKRHKDYQLSLFESERKRNEEERKIEEIFTRFTNWVRDTLEIEDNPYIRIIAVLTGV